jgi:diacylglycerol O-acyltransferase / wax synthase
MSPATLNPRRMNGVEAMLLRADRGSAYQHTLKIAIVDPSEDPDGWSFDRYRAIVEHQLRMVPSMRQRYVDTPLGIHHPLWIDDPDFDLDVHLRRVVCPPPGNLKQFCTLVEQVYCHPLDRNRPLWQIWVVEGLEGGRVALLALVHHAYSDGAGMRAILEAMTTTEPCDVPAPLNSDTQTATTKRPSGLRHAAWGLRDLPPTLRQLGPGIRALRKRIQLEREFAARGVNDRPLGADRQQPQPFGGTLGPGRRFACRTVPLTVMREVGKTLGGTINDVFLSCVAGSVRAFLSSGGEPPATPLVAAILLTTKPVAERPFLGGNYSSADDVWLHAEIADPVHRFMASHLSAEATKQHFKTVSDADPFALVDLVPGPMMSALARFDERTGGRLMPINNVIVSNVRGPEEARYIGRWRLQQWFSTGQVLHGATLNFTGWSYEGEFNLCVLASSRQVPNAWPLVEGFQVALNELQERGSAARPA